MIHSPQTTSSIRSGWFLVILVHYHNTLNLSIKGILIASHQVTPRKG